MNSQELRALQEAYLEVYNELDEEIASEKGKAKAAEMIAARTTASGRAKSGKGANVAAIRQIRGSGRPNSDKEGLGGTPMTPTMDKNPVRKKNYAGTGNRAARRAAALKTESYDLYDIILSHLLDEGYAETPEQAEVIMVNMSEEWRESICEAEIQPPKERVGNLTNINIPQNERDAARQRTLEKAKKMREKREKKD